MERLKQAQQLLDIAIADRVAVQRRAEERLAAPRLLAEMEAVTNGPMPLTGNEHWSGIPIVQLEITGSEIEGLSRDAQQRVAEAR
ncbi:hypothetical protein [Accumulibacter sp.]|uniref:hypothetical protein n=1 Tax=Accumulibacter sp. TaxID=2053492 RepID=UPI002632A00D|nr:hypothetical protein [Accumulibacter sp.]